jgi:Tol biopolymer transport system component
MAIDVETLEIKTITPPDSQDSGLFPSWSPDGSLIAFDCGDYICTIHPDGTDMKRLTSPGSFPVWSKDGKKIAFISSRGDLGKCLNSGGCGEVGMYSNAVFVMNSDGSDVTRLSWHNDEDIEWFAWLP